MTNTELIKTAIDSGMKLRIVPFDCFSDIIADLTEFRERDDLNDFQKWLVTERYTLDFSALDFKPESIIVAAVKLKLYGVTFLHQKKTASTIIEITDAGKDVGAFLKEHGANHVYYDYWLPQKRIAVRSGLAEYGRNNICYTDEFGSLFSLSVFLTDIPCGGDYTWREVVNMPACDGCDKCAAGCPTGAIQKDRFLLDNVNCLSAINEYGTEEFPAWVPKTAHHRPVQCIRCQEVCPANNGRWSETEDWLIFSEDETEILLSGTEREAIPQELGEKLDTLNLNWCYTSLPRNLRAMLENPENASGGPLF